MLLMEYKFPVFLEVTMRSRRVLYPLFMGLSAFFLFWFVLQNSQPQSASIYSKIFHIPVTKIENVTLSNKKILFKELNILEKSSSSFFNLIKHKDDTMDNQGDQLHKP